MMFLGEDLLEEAFHPSHPKDYVYPEHLGQLESIEFHCKLKEDKFASNFLADSLVMSENRWLEETIVYDEKDTTLKIAPKKRLTNLELAYMKMFKVREAFLRYAHGKLLDPEIKPAEIGEIRINTDHPNLEAWQENSIVLKFTKERTPIKKRR